MLTHKELLLTQEYWFERIQNLLYEAVTDYLQKENMTQTELAEKLGVTKGYVSQILSGEYNHSLKKMVALSLAVGVVPDIQFKPANQYGEKITRKITRTSSFDMTNNGHTYEIKEKPNIIPLYSKSSFNYSSIVL